jgi:hypothetical protein
MDFVPRTPEEIAQARDDWERGSRFGSVPARAFDRIPAALVAADSRVRIGLGRRHYLEARLGRRGSQPRDGLQRGDCRL